jgi:hypothetical protein
MSASSTLENDFSSQTEVDWRRSAGVLLLLFVLMSAGPTFGQEDGSRPTPGEALSIKAPNPVAHLHSVAFKNTFDFGAPDGSAYFLNIIPIIPFTVGGWDVVNRPIIPIIDVSGFIAGTPDIPVGVPGDGAFGLGDINYTAYFSPSKDKKVDWGIGPSITFPSATDDQLGSGKWSAGPAAALFHMRKPWAFALLGRQLWSFAGDSDRVDVDQLLIQPIVLYSLGSGWALSTDMIITANWDADSHNRWTVPLGGGIAKFLMIGNQPMMARLEAYYNIERPVGAPNWSLSFLVRFFFPR